MPTRFKEEMRFVETCCWCGQENESGIYRRENPETLACGGRHD
jgi:hypothetical protein